MGKITPRWALHWVVLVGAVLTGCAPVAGGPELPRPAQAAPVLTTAPPTTTTTLDPAEVMARECPTELCLVYHIDPAATWSSGEPVTVADFARTVGIMSDPLVDGPEIYDSIVSLDAIDPSTFRLALTGRVGDWPVLFERVLPEQAGDADPAALPGTGPYRIAEWVSGDRIVVRRVDDWWSSSDPISGNPSGTVNEIVFVFINDHEELLDALEDGTIDVVSTRATADLLDGLADIEGYQHVVSPGPFWEHIDFHHEDPMLSQQWVREVFALAIDREKALQATVRLIDPAATTLDNTVWMQGTDGYESHYVDRYNPAAAERLLVEHGCQREDDVYVCGDREMAFRWASTTDDPARRDLFESVRDDLEMVGIELVGDFRSPSGFVTRDFLFAGPDVWQLVNFSWRASPDPARADGTYLCDESALNVNRYCSQTVDDLLQAAGTTGDQTERAAIYNEADRVYLEDRAVIPLYQKPNLMVWRSDLVGPVPNWTQQSDLWNVSSWTGRDSIVVALAAEPAHLDPRLSDDDQANAVLSTLLYGAFGMDSTSRRIPVLVDSVDLIEG